MNIIEHFNTLLNNFGNVTALVAIVIMIIALVMSIVCIWECKK